MTWQRARIVTVLAGGPPLGTEVWVQGPPRILPHVVGIGSDTLRENVRRLRSNLLLGPRQFPAEWEPDDHLLWINPDVLELLPDFCDCPPWMHWGSWPRSS